MIFVSGHLLANRKAEVVKSAFHRSYQNTLHEVVSRLQSDLSSGQNDRTFQDSIKTICAGYLDETVVRHACCFQLSGQYESRRQSSVKYFHNPIAFLRMVKPD